LKATETYLLQGALGSLALKAPASCPRRVASVSHLMVEVVWPESYRDQSEHNRRSQFYQLTGAAHYRLEADVSALETT
jgi:hypothetical protein